MISITTPPSQHVIDVPPVPPNSNELAKNNLDYLKETTQTLSNESIIKSL